MDATASLGGRDLVVASIVLVALAGVYWVSLQPSYWGDGRLLVQLFGEGQWKRHHVLYFPTAHALKAVVGLATQADPRTILSLLSVLATSAAVALVYLSGRLLHLSAMGCLLGALLMATAPSVWFYGTTVEVHALQLAAMSAVVFWAVRARSTGRLGKSALVPAVALCALTGTHLSGALCGPALAFLALRGGDRWAMPRRVAGAALVTVAFGGFLYVMTPTTTGYRIGSASAAGVLESWSPAILWREFIRPAGALYALSFFVLLRWLWLDPRALLRPLPAAAALLFLTFLPFAFTVWIPERGAYYVCLLPVASLVACQALESSGRLGLPVGIGLLALHLSWSIAEAREWNQDYDGREWVEALVEESGGRGLVIVTDIDEWATLWCHSEMNTIYHPGRRAVSARRSLFRLVRRHRRDGDTIAIMRRFYEYDDPRVAEIVAGLVELLGEPRAGRHPAYLVFPGEGPAKRATTASDG